MQSNTSISKNSYLEIIADVLDMSVKRNTVGIAHSVRAQLDNGFELPLEMRQSHYDFSFKWGGVVMYKVIGDLYIAIVIDQNGYGELMSADWRVMVALLDKAKHDGTHNYVSTFDQAKADGEITSVADYLNLFKSSVVGLWAKPNPMSADYIEVELDDLYDTSDLDLR